MHSVANHFRMHRRRQRSAAVLDITANANFSTIIIKKESKQKECGVCGSGTIGKQGSEIHHLLPLRRRQKPSFTVKQGFFGLLRG